MCSRFRHFMLLVSVPSELWLALQISMLMRLCFGFPAPLSSCTHEHPYPFLHQELGSVSPLQLAVSPSLSVGVDLLTSLFDDEDPSIR